ncbi:hypothetical protein ACUN3I_11940 [Hafnia alvei]|uniref:hypothetical protein n=1 Tax=Hafnia TaxID=568 RepID=UPI00210D3871|nr:hypothetical protein [Hafnia paralvei]MCQ4169683.1 hypothetical protein [Hafnia paralvei]
MTDILLKFGLIIFWFTVVVACGAAYLWAIIFAIAKGWLGEKSSKVVYFLTFVLLAAIVFKLPLL